MSLIRIAEIISPNINPTSAARQLVNQIKIANVATPNISIPSTPQYLAGGTGQIRVGEIKVRTIKTWSEDMVIDDNLRARLVSTEIETLGLADTPLRLIFRTLTEDTTISETFSQYRTVMESLVFTETTISRLQRVLEESFYSGELTERLSPLRFEENVNLIEQIPRHFILEAVYIQDHQHNLLRELEDVLSLPEKFHKLKPFPFPTIPRGEHYTSPISLFSIGMTKLWQLVLYTKATQLKGEVSLLRKRTKIINIVESIGPGHEPSPKWQKYASSVESWTNIFQASPSWLDGFIVRDAFADRKRLVLVLMRAVVNVSKLRIESVDSVKIVVLNFTTNPPTVKEFNEIRLFPNARDKFGFFTMGHGLFVGIVGNHAFGTVFNETTGEADFLRFAYISEEFRKANYPYPTILVVPEGFLFLPANILYDLETFHNLPSLNANAFYLPIYPSHPVIVRREAASSGAVTINEAYIWQGISAKFVRMDILPSPTISPVAPSLKGDVVNNQWISWGLSGDNFDEHLLYTYKAYYNPDTRKWELLINRLPYSYFPLSNTGIWSYLPAEPRWKEICLSLTSNGDVLYFNRLWNRVYRVQLSAEGPIKVSRISYWDALLNRQDEKVIENPVIMHVVYDRYNGEVYSIAASIPPAHPYISISKQDIPYNPPPPPTIVFPPHNWTTSRRPVIIIRPAIHNKPQEFLIRLVPKEFVDRHEIAVEEAPGYEFFSATSRAGWEVSLDGGITWQPMKGPVLRQNFNTNVLVKFNTPAALPESNYYYILVSAYSRSP